MSSIGGGRKTGGIGGPAKSGGIGKTTGFTGDSLSPDTSSRFSRSMYPTTTSSTTSTSTSTSTSTTTTA